MVFYRTPWTRYGIPWNCIGTSGNPMVFHGTPRYSMEFHGSPWNSITTSWNSVKLHGIPWNSMDTPWNSMEFHGFPWNSMEVFHTGIEDISLVKVNISNLHKTVFSLIKSTKTLKNRSSIYFLIKTVLCMT